MQKCRASKCLAATRARLPDIPCVLLYIPSRFSPQSEFLHSFGTGLLLDHGSQWRGVVQEALMAIVVLWALERIGLKDAGAPPLQPSCPHHHFISAQRTPLGQKSDITLIDARTPPHPILPYLRALAGGARRFLIGSGDAVP